MGVFHFKLFDVRNGRAALKVGTDAVLLGALMTLRPTDRHLLDIGTGTGVIALMAAQRASGGGATSSAGGGAAGVSSGGGATSSAGASSGIGASSDAAGASSGGGAASSAGLLIEAVDIDAPSAEEAAGNFADSPWAGMLTARRTALQEYSPDRPFDLIFTNPPFYDNSLTNPDPRAARARHTESLSCTDICSFAAAHLNPDGHLAMILPAEQEIAACRTAASFGLMTERIVRIRSTPAKKARRVVLEFALSASRPDVRQESLTILSGGLYTPEYRDLARPFLTSIQG